MSERRACRVMGQHRSTQRRAKAPPTAAEDRLREHLRDFAEAPSPPGWRKAHAVARREGLVTNPKRTRRLWTHKRVPLNFALAGAGDPEVILLDEPTTGFRSRGTSAL